MSIFIFLSLPDSLCISGCMVKAGRVSQPDCIICYITAGLIKHGTGWSSCASGQALIRFLCLCVSAVPPMVRVWNQIIFCGISLTFLSPDRGTSLHMVSSDWIMDNPEICRRIYKNSWPNFPFLVLLSTRRVTIRIPILWRFIVWITLDRICLYGFSLYTIKSCVNRHCINSELK